jgi:hypothetical protein
MYISTVHAHVHVLLHGSRKVTSVRDIAEAKTKLSTSTPRHPNSSFAPLFALYIYIGKKKGLARNRTGVAGKVRSF